MTNTYDFTDAEADAYMAGKENQAVRDVIAAWIHADAELLMGTTHALPGQDAAPWRVLDIGCGRGIDAARYAPEHYKGLDSSPSLIRAAQRAFPQHAFEVAYVRPPDIPSPGPDVATYEYTMMKSILEHTAGIGEALYILQMALLRTKRAVFVAWHTFPILGSEHDRISMPDGYLGRPIFQNQYRLEPFVSLVTMRGWRFAECSHVENFQLWRLERNP
jgi:SAM-dependent methyltransferase